MTIKDLAAQTGYSLGTISRVLNNQPNVSQKARDTILRAAAESGFQLNANAKNLKQQHGTSILVVVKGISNELFRLLVEEIQARVAESQYPVFVDYVDENANEVRRALQLCLEKKPLGILFLGGNRENFLSDFDKIRIPSVLVTNDASDLPYNHLCSVSSDNVLAAKLAIEHLVTLGHRKIAVIGGPRQESDTTRLRFQGCMAAFREHGVAFDETEDYEAVRFSYQGGYEAAQNLLKRGREFTALFAMSDVMAIGALRALVDAGKTVPGDVSVVGFDGLPIGGYINPRLSTVVQDVRALADRSVRLLLEQIGSGTGAGNETVPVNLLARESSARIE